MIAALLGWTKLPQWALELIVIAAAVGAVFYWQHHLIDEGINKQKAADAVELKVLVAKNDKETADLKAKATTAEQAYDKEHADNVNYRDTHPTGPVRLCLAVNQGSGAMPGAGAKDSGDAKTSSAPTDVSKVSGGNNSGGAGTPGPDISGLLGLLAIKADNVSSTLREFQSR